MTTVRVKTILAWSSTGFHPRRMTAGEQRGGYTNRASIVGAKWVIHWDDIVQNGADTTLYFWLLLGI